MVCYIEEVDSTQHICNGANSLINVADATAEDCPYGGKVVESGSDDGGADATEGDGILQASEVETTTLICNPTPTNLSQVTALGSDAQCPGGWQLIELGGDANVNGTLDAEEIAASFYICNQLPYIETDTDLAVLFGEDLALMASAVDGDGESLEIEWVQTTGTMGVFDDATSLTPIFTAPSPTYRERITLELRVTDDRGATAVTEVSVMVTPVL